MARVRRRATSKASLMRALRANKVRVSSVRTIKRAGKTTTGIYSINLKKRKRR